MNRLHLLVAVSIALPMPVFAHHGWSEYDATQVLKLTGTIEAAAVSLLWMCVIACGRLLAYF